MKPQYLLFAALLFLAASCRKTYTYTCTNPQILIQQEGYDSTAWDTVITWVYNKGYLPPVIADTFITTDITNELLIEPSATDPKDFEIYLPSVNRKHKVYDIQLTTRTTEVEQGQKGSCYNRVAFMVDGEAFSYEGHKTVYATIRP